MVMYSLAAMLLCAGLLSRFTGSWVNPIFALTIPQAILLIAYDVALAKELITFRLGDKAVWLLCGGYLAFVFGALSVHLALPIKRNPAILQPKELKLANKLVRLSIYALAVCVALKYFVLLRTYGDIAANIVQIRADYVFGTLNYGFANTVAFVASSFLVLNLGILLGSGVKNRRQLLISIGLVIANDITIGGANWTFFNSVLLLCAWAVANDRVTKIRLWRTGKRLMLPAALVASVVFAIFYFRSEGRYGTEESFLNLFLYYTGGDIASFGYFVENPYPSDPAGRHTFGGLYEIIVGLAPMDGAHFYADIGIPFNTTIHLSHYYSDFGEIGVIVISMLLGVVSTAAMVAYRKRLTLVSAQYFALMLYMCVASIRSVPTEGKSFWALLALLPFIAGLSYWLPYPKSRQVHVKKEPVM